MDRSRRDGDGVYIALFNLGEKKRTISLSAGEAGWTAFRGQEFWSGKPLRKTDLLRVSLPPHDAAVYLVK